MVLEQQKPTDPVAVTVQGWSQGIRIIEIMRSALTYPAGRFPRRQLDHDGLHHRCQYEAESLAAQIDPD